jgi:flagellar biosynthetic protein FliR
LDLAQLLQWNLSFFFLIFARWGGMIMLAPVFGARGVPVLVKLGLVVSITAVMYPLLLGTQVEIPQETLPYVGVLIKELLFGLVIGFVISLVTSVIQGAGQLIAFQMGFLMGNFLDPVNGTQSPVIANFQMILTTMLLLAFNAHHIMIAAMAKSYTFVPIVASGITLGADFCISLILQVFSMSIQIALPVFGALVLADVGVGLLSRTVPQLNIMSVIFPVKIIFGFILLFLSMLLFGETVNQLFRTNMVWLYELFRGWGP